MFYTDPQLVSVYVNAICNLKCSYCFINKNKSLEDLDRLMAENFKTNYYQELIDSLYTDKEKLRIFEVWGGEPFLSMERAFPLLEHVIQNYPNFEHFTTSTNFTIPSMFDKILGVFEIFAKYPERHFSFELQISCDGPAYITDYSRGAGVTEKIVNNFAKLMDMLDESMPDNVSFVVHTKSTIDNTTMQNFLDKEKIIEFFEFFEVNFIDKVNATKCDRIEIASGFWNMATPYDYTPADGIMFAQICKNHVELASDNAEGKILKYVTDISPFSVRSKRPVILDNSFKLDQRTCDPGSAHIALLPNNYISFCHRAFNRIAENYKNEIDLDDEMTISTKSFTNDTSMICERCQLGKFMNRVDSYLTTKNENLIAGLVSQLRILASLGLIDEKYKDTTTALHHGKKFLRVVSTCVYDNEIISGSYNLYPNGIIILMFNGAMDYFMAEM